MTGEDGLGISEKLFGLAPEEVLCVLDLITMKHRNMIEDANKMIDSFVKDKEKKSLSVMNDIKKKNNLYGPGYLGDALS
jgi:hypothetical protein